ncbi:MAG TPA: hypothetical protein VHG91_20580 [Longimicrobium sp.]|nr:hypothetical protein [Longimicrobium sp.]
MATPKTRPYWLAGGTERCDFCEHPYVHQTGRRCAGCDRGCCGQCFEVDRETGEALCAECLAEARGEGEG